MVGPDFFALRVDEGTAVVGFDAFAVGKLAERTVVRVGLGTGALVEEWVLDSRLFLALLRAFASAREILRVFDVGAFTNSGVAEDVSADEGVVD